MVWSSSYLIERSSQNHQPTTQAYYDGGFIQIFLEPSWKVHQRCRFAPLSFHPWSWWDARRDSAQFSSSVHQYFFSCTHSSVQSPPVSVLLTRDRSSLCSRREIIILKQTGGFLREDHCNFLTPKHPSISLQTFYYVWNIILRLEVLQEQPVGCARSITKRKGNCTLPALTFS